MIVPKGMRPPERFKPIYDHDYKKWFKVMGQFRIPELFEYYWSPMFRQILRNAHGTSTQLVIMVPCEAPK